MAKSIIGRVERVSLPKLNLFDIDAKIDTGAYTSSIHCHHINKLNYDGKNIVQFKILDPTNPNYQDIKFQLPIHSEKNVKSSSGESMSRIFIKTPLTIFNKTFKIELSLTDRSKMKYPILLGRKAIRGKFLVDVANKYVSNQIEERGTK
ncbi:MAG: RimK/LysX family protein [Spirochaetota bacterium]|nr:RimK/LysX family protein [Spirochaetota bacterium]